jgi:hypothetical protein
MNSGGTKAVSGVNGLVVNIMTSQYQRAFS